MLNAIIRFALHNRLLILVLCVVVLVYGSYTAASLPIDVFPDLNRPRVVVMTECPGLAAEEVETLVSYPLESALMGATGVLTVRSQSGPSLSVVQVEFDWGTDIYIARQVVAERLSAIGDSLPADIQPHMAPISSILGQILLIGLARKPGPQGGLLVPVQDSPYLAEWLADPTKGEVAVTFWDPRDDRQRRLDDPAKWQAVRADPVAMSLFWSPATEEAPVLLAPRQDNIGSGAPRFSGRDPRLMLAPANGDQDTSSPEYRFTVSIAGRKHRVLVSAQQQALELRTVADWIVRPRLLKVPGIAQITVMGGGRKQYQVLLDPNALFQHGVTLEEVETALRKNNINATGGFTDRAGREQAIRIFGRLGPDPQRVLEQIRLIPVKQTPQRTVLIEQVAARVIEGPQLKRGDSSVNGLPGVLMTVNKQPHTDTRHVTSQILEVLKEVEQTLPADIDINAEVFQMKNFIDRGVFNVAEALAIGAALVIIVLFLFLLNFRTTFISLTAIPLSLGISALVFKLIGWLSGTELSINVMTLGGIAVAMGELVDDAIVDVENIFRRLREWRSAEHAERGETRAEHAPRSALRVIYEASVEIRSAIVFGTAVVILVFLPLFALSGIEGRLFTPLGVAYIVSILASLVVSLTVTPVLSYYLLPQAKATHRIQDSPLLRVMKRGASGLIRLSMAWPGWILLASWGLVFLAGWQLTRLGSDFLPPFDEGSIQVNLTLPPGASLEASNQMCAIADGRFRRMRQSAENPNGIILHFVRKTGRAELDEHVDPVSASEYVLVINPHSGKTREEILREILESLAGDADKKIPAAIPFASVEAEQPLAHLISHMLTGVTSQVSVKIYGDDLDTLRRVAERVQAAMNTVDGVTTPVIEAQEHIEEVQIKLRPHDLAVFGIDREHAAHYVQVALQGQVVSQVIEGQRRFDLLVRLDEPYRTDIAGLGKLRVDIPGKNSVIQLDQIADITSGYSPNLINRENARRRLVVRCNVLGRDLGSVAQDIRERLGSQVVLPAGYFIELGGQFEAQREATRRISLLALVSLLGMYVVLYMLYPSTRIVLQILNALPTAFIGGVLALVLTGQTLTVAALVGFISLGGIAVRNGILLVTHYFHLMRHEGEGFTTHMILRGSLERLAPVLMTALTAAIALLPLVLGGQQPGREILYPVATVILGGLITSTLCEFLIHPGLFWRFSGKDAIRLNRKVEEYA